jgi:hypothetical protein
MKYDVLLFIAIAVALAVEPALEFLTTIRGRGQ